MSQIVRILKAFRTPRTARAYLRDKYYKYYIILNNFVRPPNSNGAVAPSGLPALNEIRQRARVGTDVSDHLVNMFVEALGAQPSLIVELGVRGGESSFVFERVARLCNSRLVSVDIEDCADVANGGSAVFVRSDDVEFAGRFGKWCAERGIDPRIDLLFIDTSHLHGHTVDEINYWFPLLSTHATVLLHDTNLREVYRRKNGSMGRGWDNDRGVIRALEKYFDTRFDETQDFLDFKNGWLIKHYHTCNGFTILRRVLPGQAGGEHGLSG
ncbi:MAG: class I SAM-dependent methyltransferase [Candidatus Krumholzibacteriia bacterium]